MNCHQVLSGACNSGDQCFAVGSVEGIPFTVSIFVKCEPLINNQISWPNISNPLVIEE